MLFKCLYRFLFQGRRSLWKPPTTSWTSCVCIVTESRSRMEALSRRMQWVATRPQGGAVETISAAFLVHCGYSGSGLKRCRDVVCVEALWFFWLCLTLQIEKNSKTGIRIPLFSVQGQSRLVWSVLNIWETTAGSFCSAVVCHNPVSV